jgi:hypothetical protein
VNGADEGVPAPADHAHSEFSVHTIIPFVSTILGYLREYAGVFITFMELSPRD